MLCIHKWSSMPLKILKLILLWFQCVNGIHLTKVISFKLFWHISGILLLTKTSSEQLIIFLHHLTTLQILLQYITWFQWLKKKKICRYLLVYMALCDRIVSPLISFPEITTFRPDSRIFIKKRKHELVVDACICFV